MYSNADYFFLLCLGVGALSLAIRAAVEVCYLFQAWRLWDRK